MGGTGLKLLPCIDLVLMIVAQCNVFMATDKSRPVRSTPCY